LKSPDLGQGGKGLKCPDFSSGSAMVEKNR
jgi:hypothetical protein